MSNTQVIILAGGKGKRMGSEIPKVLTPFKGRPIIEYIVNVILDLSLEAKPMIVVGFGSDLVKEHLGDDVCYALQDKQLGTGHAVMCAKDVCDKNSNSVLVLYGDHPNTKLETVKKILDLHSKEDSVITMAVLKVPNFNDFFSNFYGFGRIIRDSDGKISRITEVKDATDDEKDIKELNPSFFCFDADWLWSNISKLQNSNAQQEYYLTDMVGLAIEQGKKISSIEIDYLECVGINTLEELKRAEDII